MQESIITIRTLDCDVCDRYDSIMLSYEEVVARSNSTEMGIGAYSVIHKNHTRIVYFDKDGTYLGDTIAMNQDEIPESISSQPLPYYIKNKKKSSTFTKLRKFVFSRIHRKNLTIAIVGPSRAGKTSLVRYLQTLVPESEGQVISSVPTMGKSKKRMRIGKSSITTLDLGGQEDFWDLWDPAMAESDVVIFLLDATSNNVIEVAKAFERAISQKDEIIPALVIMNKKDLILRGDSSRFMSSGEFLSLTNLKLPIPNVMSIEASIFEGKVYEKSNLEEINLAETISAFLLDYC